MKILKFIIRYGDEEQDDWKQSQSRVEIHSPIIVGMGRQVEKQGKVENERPLWKIFMVKCTSLNSGKYKSRPWSCLRTYYITIQPRS